MLIEIKLDVNSAWVNPEAVSAIVPHGPQVAVWIGGISFLSSPNHGGDDLKTIVTKVNTALAPLEDALLGDVKAEPEPDPEPEHHDKKRHGKHGG